MGKHHSDEIKQMAIEYYLKNKKTQEEISKIFQISRQTFIRWLKRYNNNKLERKNIVRISYKIKKKHLNYALKELNKNKGISINILWNKIRKKYDDFNITPGHLSQVIRDNNVTRKRTTRRHYPETRYNKTIDYKKELMSFYKITDKFSINKIISIDETSIYAQMPSSY